MGFYTLLVNVMLAVVTIKVTSRRFEPTTTDLLVAVLIYSATFGAREEEIKN